MSLITKYLLPVVLLILLGLFILWYPRSLSGTLYHSTARVGNITIYRDGHGIPHIHTSSYLQAAFGMGFTMAQDRLWSLHIRRALAQGRLSEIFGTHTVGLDKFIRTIGIGYHTNKAMKNIDSYTLSYYEAFAAGVNEYLKSRYLLPAEFWLMWTDCEPFTAFDSISIYKYASFAISNDWIAEQMRASLSQALGPEKAEEIITISNPFEETLIINDDELKKMNRYSEEAANTLKTKNFTREKNYMQNLYKKDRTLFNWDYFFSGQTELERFLISEIYSLDTFKGSNSWVLHGNLTDTGKPILAMDLHLPNVIPSIWYQVEIVIKEEHSVIGAALVGVPGILSGKNNHVAWVSTVLNADSVDLYEETLNSQETQYLFEGKYHDLVERLEIIKLYDGSEIQFPVYHTRHGPLLTNYTLKEVPTTQYPNKHPKKYSLAWAGAWSSDTDLGLWVKLFKAETSQQVIKIFEGSVLTQNILFATVNGDIGYIGAGRFIKRAHYQNAGFPKNGTSVQDEWVGITQPKDLIRIVNPEKGYIIAANNKVTSDLDKNFFSVGMQSNSRAYRIEQLIKQKIQGKGIININDCKAWQMDVRDAYVERILPNLTRFIQEYEYTFKGIQTSAIDKLLARWKSWASSFESKENAPLVFAIWETRMKAKLLHNAQLSEEERRNIVSSHWFDQFFFARLQNWTSGLNLNDEICHGGNETQTPVCAYIIIKSSEEAINTLTQKNAPRNALTWGSQHPIEYPNLPFSYTPFSFLYHRSVYGSGNQRTINYAKYQQTRKGFPATASANLRMVMDMSPNAPSFYVLDTGVSENPFSYYYDDQMKYHVAGRYLEMTTTNNNGPLNTTDTFRIIFSQSVSSTEASSEVSIDDYYLEEQEPKINIEL